MRVVATIGIGAAIPSSSVAVAVLVIAAVACSSAEPTPADPAVDREPTAGATTSPTPAAAGSPSGFPDVVELGELVESYPYELRGGEATVGDARLEVPLGDTIDLLVLSDVDDVVLVPGLGIEQRVAAGERTRVSVTVKRPGTFVVATAAGVRLTELVVEPASEPAPER